MYVDNGTFWAITIALAVAIGIVYLALKEKVDKCIEQNTLIAQTLKEMSRIIDEEFVAVRQEHSRKAAEIYSDVADVIENLENSIDKDKKKKAKKTK